MVNGRERVHVANESGVAVDNRRDATLHSSRYRVIRYRTCSCPAWIEHSCRRVGGKSAAGVSLNVFRLPNSS